MFRKPALLTLLVCALILGLLTPSIASTRDDLRKKRNSLNGQLGSAQKSYDQSSAEYAKAKKSLDAAEAKLDGAKAKLSKTRGALAVAKAKDAEMQAKLQKAEAELATAKAALNRGEAKLNQSEEQVREFTLESLRDGDRGFKAFSELIEGESPTTFSERMSANASVSDAQLALMQRLDASRVMLAIRRDEVQKLRNQVAEARRRAAENLALKRQLEIDAKAQADSVADLVSEREGLAAKANKVKQADGAKLRALEADRARLTAQLQALARQAAARSGGGGGGGGGSFNNGGALSYPARGPITSPFGMRLHPVTGIYKLHDGTDFGIPCGTPVYAAASGQIIQQYFNAGYGNRVIVNNGVMRGVSVVTTYNHLSRFALPTGARVSRGQLIGYSGTTGYSTGCHLHFMVLSNGAPVNPMGWL